jgi:hypothetical protein
MARKPKSIPPADVEPPSSSAPMKVYWDKDPTRTDRLLDWLEQNTEDRQKLFSDSAQDMKESDRRRRVAKGSKMVFYTKIALYVFSVDQSAEVREDFLKNAAKYGKSVENRLQT